MNILSRFSLSILLFTTMEHHAFSGDTQRGGQHLFIETQNIIEAIKEDDTNTSFTEMIDEIVMKNYSLEYHSDHLPYFYTNERNLISEVISMVVENPDKIIDETKRTGLLKLYKTFDFSKDIAPLFVKVQRTKEGYDGKHLGTTSQEPTNQVVVLIRTKYVDSPLKASFVSAYPTKYTNN